MHRMAGMTKRSLAATLGLVPSAPEALSVTITDVGRTRLNVRGESTAARYYKIVGDLWREIWYDYIDFSFRCAPRPMRADPTSSTFRADARVTGPDMEK